MAEVELEGTNTDEIPEAVEYLQMGQVLLGNQNYEEAVQMINKSLELNPMDKIAYISKGICFASMEEYLGAKECFKKAVKIDKTFADAYFQLGNIAFLEDDFQEGIKNYNHAVSYGYQDAGLYYNLALVYEEQENVEEAIRNYSKASALDETNPEYLIRKASLQIMITKYEEALQTLEKIRNRFPDSFEGYHLTAAAYTMMGKYAEADEILRNALVLFPDDKEILFDRVRILITKGDMEKALKLLDQAKESECTPTEMKEIMLNEAKIKGQMEQLEETISLLNQALKIEQGENLDSEIRYFLLNALFIKREFTDMYEVAQQIDKEDTMNPYSLCGMYYECLAAKEKGIQDFKQLFQNAVRYYRNISVKDPSRVDAFLFRAMCYREIEEYDKAEESIDYVLLLQPDNAQLHQIKGNLLRDQGKTIEAQAEYSEAKRLGLSVDFLNMLGGI